MCRLDMPLTAARIGVPPSMEMAIDGAQRVHLVPALAQA